MSNGWGKIKVICSSAARTKDCEGCGMNTVKEGFAWQLNSRIPCSNAAGGYCSFKRAKNK